MKLIFKHYEKDGTPVYIQQREGIFDYTDVFLAITVLLISITIFLSVIL